MSIQELEEEEKNSILIDYEAILVKDAKSGLGIVVKEDAKGRVKISKIEAKVIIDSMSDEAGGAIKIGDVIVAIDEDDCWRALIRIKGVSTLRVFRQGARYCSLREASASGRREGRAGGGAASSSTSNAPFMGQF